MIDKMDINDYKLYLPYEFQLLLRGSRRDGFTPKKFQKSDNPWSKHMISML